MKKICRRFFLVLILACIVNGIILWLIFGINPKTTQTKLPKPITIERIIPNQAPDLPTPSLPTMLPSPTPVTSLPNQEPAPNNTSPQEAKTPDTDNIVVKNDFSNTNNTLAKNSPENTPTTKSTTKKPRRKKRTLVPPGFDFDRINAYALAVGSSAFKNYGTNKIADEHDYAMLIYQEKARKHFAVALNSYADSNYFYNISVTQFNISIIIEKDGRAQFQAHNLANNIAIVNLIEKILIYAGLFPAIPKNLNLNNFRLDFNIRIEQGKLVRGYGWN